MWLGDGKDLETAEEHAFLTNKTLLPCLMPSEHQQVTEPTYHCLTPRLPCPLRLLVDMCVCVLCGKGNQCLAAGWFATVSSDTLLGRLCWIDSDSWADYLQRLAVTRAFCLFHWMTQSLQCCVRKTLVRSSKLSQHQAPKVV